MQQVYVGVLGFTNSVSDALTLQGIRKFAGDAGFVVVNFEKCAEPNHIVDAWPLVGAIALQPGSGFLKPHVEMFSESDTPCPRVTVDRKAALDAAYTHLRGLNPASISLVHDPEDSTSLVQTWESLRESPNQTCQRFAVRSLTPALSDITQTETERFVDWIDNLIRPAAICCTRISVAAAILHLAQRLELNVPEDLALITLEDSILAEQLGITAAIGNYTDAGFEAARILHLMLADSDVPASTTVPGAQIIRRSSTDRLAALPEDIRLAQDFILKNACKGINVKDVMETQKVSRVTFERRFKEHTGQTPGAEIRRIRIEKAADLLKETRIAVSEVASRCGFDGSSRFSLFFRKRTGLSPSEYRRRHSMS